MSSCNICLRTELKLLKINRKLCYFYSQLSENAVDRKAVFCSTCKQYLNKCLEFKKLCQESSKILKKWGKNLMPESQLNDLHTLIAPLFNKIITSETKNSKNTPEIKEEIEKNNIVLENNESLPKINDSCIENYEVIQHEDNLTLCDDFLIEPKEETDSNYIENNEIIIDNENNKNDNDLFNNDSDDDKAISQFLKDVQKKSSKTKKTSKKQDKLDKSKETPIVKRKRRKQPLKNKQEYESVFDILLFKTDEEAKAEFAERESSDYYKNASFKCTVCYTAFKCQKLLDYHMRWHDPSSGDFACDICHMRFKIPSSMRKHKNDVHYGRYRCKMCPLITYHKMVMVQHFKKHRGVEYICKHCQKVYHHSSTYLTHMRMAHRSTHACNECARTFVSPTGLRVHKQKVHKCVTEVEREGVHCKECDITFANEDVYIVHVLHTPLHKHLADTMIACPECGKRFEDKLSLRAHRRQLHPNYNYTWSKYADKTGGKKEFKCRECGATGVHNSWLYNHYRTEHPELTYEAAVYDKTRKHLCEQCGKSFVQLWQLSEHTLLHSGLRPHACNTCGASFRTGGALRMHSERHRPPNRPCNVCGKKFASASNLANHMRSHIGERRYKCSVCCKGFLHSAALREHVRGVHLHVRRDRKPKGDTVTLAQ